MEKKKMGRPPVENPKNNNMKVKIDDNTLKVLQDYAKKNNQSMASVIREAVEKYLNI